MPCMEIEIYGRENFIVHSSTSEYVQTASSEKCHSILNLYCDPLFSTAS